MENSKFKKETIDMINIMIEHADKGPSGFWTDDYEGCGNPEIFPEFNYGLKHGKLVQKSLFYCPWNTAIMYGDGHGNIATGCYHSCSINDAKYLSSEMLAAVLNRFKKRVNSGQYDQVDHLEPLLTENEHRYIQRQMKLEENKNDEREKRESELRRIKASKLLQKFADNKDICELICAYYGTDSVVDSGIGAVIFFSPDSMKKVVGGERLSYDDYIAAQVKAAGKFRVDFLNCYMNIGMEFKGEVEKVDTANNRICFKRIFVTGMFDDGTFFDGKEDHVWMNGDQFSNCIVGDCFTFCAEVYRYVKTSNGKIIDYSLRNPEGIKKIDKYDLPTDKELTTQSIDRIICESCYLSENCSHTYCMRNPKELKAIRNDMLKAIGSFDKDGNRKG